MDTGCVLVTRCKWICLHRSMCSPPRKTGTPPPGKFERSALGTSGAAPPLHVWSESKRYFHQKRMCGTLFSDQRYVHRTSTWGDQSWAASPQVCVSFLDYFVSSAQPVCICLLLRFRNFLFYPARGVAAGRGRRSGWHKNKQPRLTHSEQTQGPSHGPSQFHIASKCSCTPWSACTSPRNSLTSSNLVLQGQNHSISLGTP